MGADGGVLITKIETIKENWSTIKKQLVKDLKSMYSSYREMHRMAELDELITAAEQLPETIVTLGGKQIKELLMFLYSCDCPYLLDDTYLVTAKGDYVEDQMRWLSYALEPFGINIKTWT